MRKDMRAIVFDNFGEPPDVLRMSVSPLPEASQDNIVVQVEARPIHPADWLFIRGKYRIKLEPPQIAGLEGAGVVVDSMPGMSVLPGTRIAFRWFGTWAEFAAVPQARVIEVPQDIPDEVACQISLNPVTAWGLIRLAAVASGDWIVITAATSSVSNIIGAIARRRSVRVIGLVREDASEAHLRCTADYVLSAEQPTVVSDILDLVGGRGVSAILDSVGGQSVVELFKTLAIGGRIIAYGVQDPSPAAISNSTLIYSNVTWQGFGIDHWLESLDATEADQMHEELWEMIRDKTLLLPVASKHRLETFGSALTADNVRGRIGKVLLM